MISSGGGNLRSFTRRSTVRVLIPSRLATSALVNRSRGRPSTAVSSASSRKRMVSRRSLLMLVVQVMLGQTLTSFGQGSQRGGRHDLYRSCQLYFRGGRTWPIFLASEACFMSFPFGRATSGFIARFFCSQCAISLFVALGRSRQYSAIAVTTSSGNCASRWRVLAPALRPNARRRFKNSSSVSCHTNGACITCVGGHVAETCSSRESCSSAATTGGRKLARSPTPRTRARSPARPHVGTNRHDGGSRRAHNVLDHSRQRLEGVALLGFICVPVI